MQIGSVVAELRYQIGVRYHDNRLAVLFRQFLEDLNDLLYRGGVQVSCRFVREDQIDVGGNRLLTIRSALERTIPNLSSKA